MVNRTRSYGIRLVIVVSSILCIFAGSSSALEIALEPATAQRTIGKKVRVQIFADSAVELISMGVKVSFDPTVLQVLEAHKNTDFATGFVMDADGVEATTGDRYVTPAVEIDNAGGSVVMIGGRLMGDDDASGDTPPYDTLTGKVLLGWIDFTGIGNGNAALSVDLGRYHPNHPTDTFDNFVQLNGTVDEPSNVPANLGVICIRDDACEGDLNNDGIVNNLDVGIIKLVFRATGCFEPGNNCPADLNGDGTVNNLDVGLIKEDFRRADCACP